MKRPPRKTKPAAGTVRAPGLPASAAQTGAAQDHSEDRAVDEIVRKGPSGAFALAGIATAIVVAIYFGFYIFIYLPRGAVQ